MIPGGTDGKQAGETGTKSQKTKRATNLLSTQMTRVSRITKHLLD